MGKFANRVSGGGGRTPDSSRWSEGELERRFPALYEYLSLLEQEDGSKRTTATLLVLSDSGVLKGWFNDRDNQRAAWVSGPHLEGLLMALEQGLQDDDLDWRAAKTQVYKKK